MKELSIAECVGLSNAKSQEKPLVREIIRLSWYTQHCAVVGADLYKKKRSEREIG
ncbi:MAG: hypothetical protein ACKVIO_03265 [Phycisphaerales bacterium]